MQFKEIPLTLFKFAPTHEVRMNDALKVMVHKRVGFYAVSPERMAELLQIEEDMKDLILCNERKNQKHIRVKLEDL